MNEVLRTAAIMTLSFAIGFFGFKLLNHTTSTPTAAVDITPAPFVDLQPNQAYASFAQAEHLYTTIPPNGDFNIFVDMIATSRVAEMSVQNPSYQWDSVKSGGGTDDLFVGCVLFQFDDWDVLSKVNFRSFEAYRLDHKKLADWMQDNKDTLVKYPKFTAKLLGIAEYSARCSDHIAEMKKANGILDT